ncbi:MAG: fatty acid desaturase [Leptospirales bacterium]|nr:fatty acid desaturase [Leptospirales bacterium]
MSLSAAARGAASLRRAYRPRRPRHWNKGAPTLPRLRLLRPALSKKEIMQMYLSNGRPLAEFAAELQQAYNRARARISLDDLREMEYLVRLSLRLERWGRYKIQNAWGPRQWLTGILFLTYHYAMELTNGHAIYHGTYDRIGKSALANSDTYQWKLTMHPPHWSYDHNQNHHPFTNITGVDHDLAFYLYRASGKQDWKPYHLLQVPLFISMIVWLDLFIAWLMATSIAQGSGKTYWQAYKEAWPGYFKRMKENYWDYPLQKLWRFPQVWIGNFVAKTLGNAHILAMVAVEHLNDGLCYFEPAANETRQQYFLRQIVSTMNFYTDQRHEDLFTKGVNIHLEHHLYPDLPVNHLREFSREIQDICVRHRVPYMAKPWLEAVKDTIRAVFHYSLPVGEGEGWLSLLRHPLRTLERVGRAIRQLQPIGEFRPIGVLPSRILQVDKQSAGPGVYLKIKVPGAVRNRNWAAGSYINVQFDINGKKEVRQYSLLQPGRSSNFYEIFVKRIPGGCVSNHVATLQKGARIAIIGEPHCEFTLAGYERPKVFLAGGAGITPILSMLEDLADQQFRGALRLFYFVSDPSQILLAGRLDRLQRRLPGLRLENCCSSLGQRISKPMLSAVARELSDAEYYLCAPGAFMQKATRWLGALKVKSGDIYQERFVQNAPLRKVRANSRKHRVQLVASGRQLIVSEGQSLLEALRAAGIEHPSGCEKGLCKACECAKLSGITVLDNRKNQQTLITPCVDQARSDLELAL